MRVGIPAPGDVDNPAAVLRRGALTAAPLLLGSVLRTRVGGAEVAVRLTEVEAYEGAGDPGSHAYRGMTARNAVMFGPAGRLYVYFTYGMHHCVNVVCGGEGASSAVLIRAGEVVAGRDTAQGRRGPAAARLPGYRMASGPARLAQCLGLGLEHNGLELGGEDGVAGLGGLGAVSPSAIAQGPRVGVAGPGGSSDFPWRFSIAGDPTVSPYRAAQRKRGRPGPGDAIRAD